MKKKIVFLFFSFLVFQFFSSNIFINSADASIVLKVIAVNPSKDQNQKASVKAYLPKETKPEDILDKGDLDAAYDTQQGSYYVSGEYDLKPGEVKEIDIELRDIWVIQDTEIEVLRSDLRKIENILKNTEYADRISFIKNSIESKLNQVIDSQKNAPANPEKHISEYRDNLRVIESVKADLAMARTLMSQVKTFPAVMVWRLIVAIVIFLGLLGTGFYILWQKQVKITTDDTFYVPKDEKGEFKKEEQEAKPAEKPKNVSS